MKLNVISVIVAKFSHVMTFCDSKYSVFGSKELEFKLSLNL
jgi:hypothetical protein